MTAKSNTSQALWVGIGNLFSTGMALVSAMILSRYFNKEDYGTYKQVIYIYSTMQIVFTLGLPRCFSYFLPKLPIEQAKHTIDKINNIFYITGLTFSILLFFGAPWLASAFNNISLTTAIRIYSPVAFFLLPTLGLEGILATYQKSEYIALYNICTRLLMLLCVVLPVILFNGTYVMALWGFVVSSFITYLLAIYLKKLPLKGVLHQSSTISYKDIWGFSLPLMTASIWGALCNSTDQFFISRYFGAETFANFSNGAIQLPFVGMIMAATVTVLTPVFTRDIHEKKYSEAVELWRRSIIKPAKLIFPLLVFFIIFAKPIMVVMYGAQYDTSALFFQIKQLLAFTQVVPTAMFIMAFGRTKLYSQSMLIQFILVVPLEYFIAVYIKSAYAIAAVHVGINLILWIWYNQYIARNCGVRLSYYLPWKPLSGIMLISIIVGAITYVLVGYIPLSNTLMMLIMSVVAYSILYLLAAYIFRIEYKQLLQSLLPVRLRNPRFK